MASLLFSGVVVSSSSRRFSSSSRPNFSAFLHSSRRLTIPRSHGSSFADESNPVPKLELAISHTNKPTLQENCEIPRQPHWAFCYTMLHKISKSYALVIQQLDTKYRDAAVILYLTMRALDTVEDDTSIPRDIKVPILKSFHKDIYDPIWHFPCGTRQHDIVLMDEFHHVSNAFLELDKGCQEVIEDTMKTLGICMAKFICKEVETVDEYHEYCHYVAAILMMGWAKGFQASGSEDLPPDSLGFSIGLFAQKTHFVKDFLDDINEKPKPRIFWPREIWSKYVTKLEDLKDEENSDKAVQCLNEMTTISLAHVVDCLTYVSALREPSIFRFYAIPLIMSMGNLALGYDNIEVFRSVVEMRPGLAAKVFDQTNTMEDVYGAVFYYSCLMKSKVNKKDPSATLTLSRLDAIQKACTESGLLNNKRNLYVD